MSRKGDPWDNAPKESFYRSLKCELTHRRYHTREQARREVFEYIEVDPPQAWSSTTGSGCTRRWATCPRPPSRRSPPPRQPNQVSIFSGPDQGQ